MTKITFTQFVELLGKGAYASGFEPTDSIEDKRGGYLWQSILCEAGGLRFVASYINVVEWIDGEPDSLTIGESNANMVIDNIEANFTVEAGDDDDWCYGTNMDGYDLYRILAKYSSITDLGEAKILLDAKINL